MRHIEYELEYRAKYHAEMGMPDEIPDGKELEYIQENLEAAHLRTGRYIHKDMTLQEASCEPAKILSITGQRELPDGVLSAEDRQKYLRRLEEIKDLLQTANIEWYPKGIGEIDELEREKECLEDTIQYDDYCRESDCMLEAEREQSDCMLEAEEDEREL